MNIYGITETHIVDNKIVGERDLMLFYKTRDSAVSKGISVIKKLKEIDGFKDESYDYTVRMVLSKGEITFEYNIRLYNLED